MASIAPTSAILNALAHQSLPFRIVLGELIDNALDAGAQRVAITFQRDTFIIEDDGDGMGDVIAIVRIGDHRDHRTTKLGRFGIGAKDAILSLSGTNGTVDVRSVHGGRERSISVAWAEVGDDWNIEDPTEVPAEPGARGTRIVVRPCRRPPHGEAWRELVGEIGYLYSPAIKAGAQITLASSATTKGKPEPAPRWTLPNLESGHVDAEITVGQRRARVFAGLVAEGEPNPRAGLTYSHGFRVIVPASSKGCGDYPIARICGFVDLLSGWALAKNKNAIVTGEDELLAEVERAILPVLKRAEQASAVLGCQEFQSEVSARLNAALRAGTSDARAKRGKGSDKGTRKPTGEGGKHQQAANEQAGETFRGKRGGGFLVEHAHLGGDALGRVDGNKVLLNLDLPFVAQVQRMQNVEAGVALAACLIGDVARGERASGQRYLRSLETDSFPKAMGRILASHPMIDGRPVLKAVGP